MDFDLKRDLIFTYDSDINDESSTAKCLDEWADYVDKKGNIGDEKIDFISDRYESIYNVVCDLIFIKRLKDRHGF